MGYQSQWDGQRDAILAVANRVKAANPSAWEEVKVPGQKSRRFISLVAAECQSRVSVSIGCNLKRGGPEVSLDVLAMPNASGCRDASGIYEGLELRDIINSAEGPNANLAWGDATPATIAANVSGGWIKTATSGTPPPVTMPSYEDLGGDAYFAEAVGKPLAEDMATATATHGGGPLNAGSSTWFSRPIFRILHAYANGQTPDKDAIIKSVRNEWRSVLRSQGATGLPPL